MVPLPADARVCMLSVSLTIHVDVFYHLALMCAFYHFRDSKRIFQDGADERLIYATTLLEYRALSLRVKKRSSSTLALNKSGEGNRRAGSEPQAMACLRRLYNNIIGVCCCTKYIGAT